MPKGFEQPKINDEGAQVESEREIKWVYSSSVPAAEGRPDVQLVIGVPQGSDWLQRDNSDQEQDVYAFELPVNLVAGSDTAHMTISGRVKAGPGRDVQLLHTSLAQNTSDRSRSKAWMENYEGISGDWSWRLSEAVLEQCRMHLRTEGTPGAQI